ncbi:MAG: retroviral-like aspartic protease family protein [Chitinophagales bacterium]|nr:retroviral-like aspartic protease family protein [Chitinophagales bacterium]
MSKKIKVPIEVVSLQEEGFHLFVKGKLNDHSLSLLIDTGASKTVLDKNFLSLHFPELKLESNEQLATGVGNNTIKSEITVIKELSIGELKIAQYEVAVLDLKHVNDTYSLIALPPIHGVIGCDLLVEYQSAINMKKKSLRLHSPKKKTGKQNDK